MTGCLSLKSVQVHYGKAEAIGGVTVEVQDGSVTGIIGANGAGKSTIMKAISGTHRSNAGEIWFQGKRIDRLEPHRIVELGVVQIPEGRRLFPHMSVLGNIRIGAYMRNDRPGIKEDMEDIFRRFPVLRERQNQRAETLSGGEQQMLAIGRALMAKPRLLLMDEPSWGLAPLVVEELARTIQDINRKGITVLLVEQNAGLALNLTDYVYVLEVGRVVLEGKPSEIKDSETVRSAFLG
ncbi:MAG: ABC transporter ATP-binding protein [Desulfobacteraceae bacterium]|nr:MAG: ABC transporter ATP-binding protein [Desulfobacteraceae bacterium]